MQQTTPKPQRPAPSPQTQQQPAPECAEAKPFTLSDNPEATDSGTKNTSAKADILRRALRHYGYRGQVIKTAEECSELSAAIMRFISPEPREQDPIIGLVEELADVEIMLKQMRLIFGNSAIDDAVVVKLNRLEKRLDDAQSPD